MHRIWRQTPDGRPAATNVSRNRNPEALERRSDNLPVVELAPFVDGCLTMLPERSRDNGERMGFFLFLLGAGDRFWELNGLDDKRFPAYTESLLRRLDVPAETAATIAADLSLLPKDGPVGEAMVHGRETLDEWIASGDPNIPLRVKELMPRWRQTEWQNGEALS
jgi:hypothetical protein